MDHVHQLAGSAGSAHRARLAARAGQSGYHLPLPTRSPRSGRPRPPRTALTEAPTLARLPDVGSPSVLTTLDPGGTLAGDTRAPGQADAAALRELRIGPDKYLPVRLLGRGGMGEIFLVFDRDLQRWLALKTIRPSQKAHQRRFIEEAQIIGQLQHPNIVAVHELGLTRAGKVYYTMPVLRGSTLEQILQGLRRGEKAVARGHSLVRLIQIFLQVAQAIGYAHARGVIHRDVKPSNVMLGEHGEVQVLDWGLSKMEDAAGASGRRGRAGATLVGHVVGTPAYMSPEQARGGRVDARADVYALGVLLYELLTLARPFEGTGAELLRAHLEEEPAPPRRRAPRRAIPAELERICLHALRKDPAERPQTARELHDAVQHWLEAEADRARRRERAEEWAQRGRERLQAYRSLQEEVRGRQAEAEALALRFKPFQPVREKAPLVAARDRVEEAHARLAEASADVVSALEAALAFEPEHAEARGLLADYYWGRFRQAEEARDTENQVLFRKQVASYHDGRYARELLGHGSLALTSHPPGAEVTLFALTEKELRLVPGRPRRLGTTPLGPVSLPMGRYLAVLRREGFRDTRCPVAISRNRDWRQHVSLYRDEEIGEGYLYVPGGPFLAGGDPETAGWSLGRAEPELPGFFITRHPVAVAEYMEFLEELARTDWALAERHSPRAAPDGGAFVTRGPGGRLLPPRSDVRGEPWPARWPVASVSWHDAVAYCAWRSKREGRTVRLPEELEWEKAARGVDGRYFPWGDRFDASLCNMQDSLPGATGPRPVDAFPEDLSVYGVRGLAGNVRDWTVTPRFQGDDGGEGTRVIRGGAFNLPAHISRCANRFWLAPSFVLAYTGFRVAASAPARPRGRKGRRSA
jgi:serine/threonine-protein kinase